MQQILDGRWQHASAARQACRDKTWAAFVRETAPARPARLGRRDHARCLPLAASAPAGPFLASVELVPLWGCVTDEAPADEWVAVHGSRWERRTLDLQNPARSSKMLRLEHAIDALGYTATIETSAGNWPDGPVGHCAWPKQEPRRGRSF